MNIMETTILLMDLVNNTRAGPPSLSGCNLSDSPVTSSIITRSEIHAIAEAFQVTLNNYKIFYIDQAAAFLAANPPVLPDLADLIKETVYRSNDYYVFAVANAFMEHYHAHFNSPLFDIKEDECGQGVVEFSRIANAITDYGEKVTAETEVRPFDHSRAIRQSPILSRIEIEQFRKDFDGKCDLMNDRLRENAGRYMSEFKKDQNLPGKDYTPSPYFAGLRGVDKFIVYKGALFIAKCIES